MSIQQTKHGTWQVRWRDRSGRHFSKSVRTKELAIKLERQMRAATDLGRDPVGDPLWRRMLRQRLGDRAAIDVGGFNPNGHFVYLLWGSSDDRPLYIGRSSNVLARLGNHMVRPDRRHRITRVTLVRCFTAEDAAETEADLIDFYQCELNVLDGNGKRAAWNVEQADSDVKTA
jgi:hypothetical protein